MGCWLTADFLGGGCRLTILIMAVAKFSNSNFYQRLVSSQILQASFHANNDMEGSSIHVVGSYVQFEFVEESFLA